MSPCPKCYLKIRFWDLRARRDACHVIHSQGNVCDLHFVQAILLQGISISHPHNLEWPHVSVQFTKKGEKVVTNCL